MKLNYLFVHMFLIFLFVAACSTQHASAQVHAGPAKATDNKAAQIDAIFRDYDRPDAPGASVIVISKGKVLFKRAYGLADPEKKTNQQYSNELPPRLMHEAVYGNGNYDPGRA